MSRWYLLSIGFLGIAAGCGSAKHEYPPEVTAAFVSRCEIRAPRGACECTLEAIRRRFTYEQFTALEQQTRDTGKMPAAFQDAARECR